MRLTVGQRLALPFLFTTLLLVALGAFGVIGISRLSNNTEQIIQEHQPVLNTIVDVKSDVMLHSLRVDQYVTTGNRTYLVGIDQLQYDIEATLSELDSQTWPRREEELVDQLQDTYDTYISMSDELRNFYRENSQDLAGLEERQMEMADLLDDSFLLTADALRTAVDKRIEGLIQSDDQLHRRFHLIGGTLSLVSVVVALVLSRLIQRSILKPINHLAQVIERLASGDLTARTSLRYKDEIGRLARGIDAMAFQLRGWVENLERRVEERTRNLLTAAEVARATTSVLDPDQLLVQVVNLVRQRFDLYYVGLFLLDPARKYAVLRAGTGEAGQTMLNNGHRLEVGGESMIGQCTASGHARIALDVGEEAVRFENPVLPDTRSELALPLTARGRVLGAMTVQSLEEAAFDETDVAVMQTMADQVAVAINNAQLFADAQAALSEMEAAQRRYVGRAWAEYVRGGGGGGYEYVGGAMNPLDGEAAITMSDLESEEDTDGGNGREPLVVPIKLRGQPIGMLGFEDREGGWQWGREDAVWAEGIAEQLALAVDNLRLLDETQRRAARERLIGDVTARVRETLDVDAVLDTAVREISRTFSLTALDVQLGTPDTIEDTVEDAAKSESGDL